MFSSWKLHVLENISASFYILFGFSTLDSRLRQKKWELLAKSGATELLITAWNTAQIKLIAPPLKINPRARELGAACWSSARCYNGQNSRKAKILVPRAGVQVADSGLPLTIYFLTRKATTIDRWLNCTAQQLAIFSCCWKLSCN